MKITCQSCQAKYTIADEKVAGKTVKIKCKKCGSPIVVSGSDAAGAGPIPAPAASNAVVAAPPGDDDDGEDATRVLAGGPGGVDGEEWTVNVTDDDQRTLTGTQIVIEYHRGVITRDTYVWKDGMPDWLPLSDVPDLMRLISPAPQPAAGAPPAALAPAPQPVAMPAPAAMPPPAVMPAPTPAFAPVPERAPALATPAQPAGGLGGTIILNEPAATGGGNRAPAQPIVSPMATAPLSPATPAAARRSGKAGGVDLFAPGAEVVPAASSAAPSPADRLVGERNENSVLFSISALTASAGAGTKHDEALDRGARPAPRNGRGNVDDIMNLGGGMAGPMLAPPPLLAPVVAAPPPPPMAPVIAAPAMGVSPQAFTPSSVAPPKSKTPLVLGVLVVVALLGGGGAFFAMRGGSTPSGGPESTNTAATTAVAPTESATVAPPATAAPSPPPDTAKPADTGTPAGATPSAAPTSNAKPVVAGVAKVDKPADTKPEKPAEAKPTEAKPEKPADPPAEAKPEKPAEAKPEKPADTGGGGKEFDRAAAISALATASGAARSCKKDDGPTGTARVKVTFAPSGSVTSSSVDGPPFAGTAVGGCIAAAFRGAHIPAFDGSPVSVSRSVSIN